MGLSLAQRFGPGLILLSGLAVLTAYTRYHVSHLPRVSLDADAMEDNKWGERLGGM